MDKRTLADECAALDRIIGQARRVTTAAEAVLPGWRGLAGEECRAMLGVAAGVLDALRDLDEREELRSECAEGRRAWVAARIWLEELPRVGPDPMPLQVQNRIMRESIARMKIQRERYPEVRAALVRFDRWAVARRERWMPQTITGTAVLLPAVGTVPKGAEGAGRVGGESLSGGGEREPVALTRADAAVLKALCTERSGRLLTIEAIAENLRVERTPLTEKTVGRSLKRLIAGGLADRPEGPKGGAIATNKGRRQGAMIPE